MMQFLVLLLFVSAANHAVGFKLESLTFTPVLLQPDLKAIEYYFENIAHDINAYVHWPNDITFMAQYHKVQDQGYYLNITGTFKVPSEGCIPLLWNSYNGLYYKDKKFYFLTRKESLLKLIPDDTPLHYTQPQLAIHPYYLSVKYFGLNDLKNMIQPFYSEHKYYIDHQEMAKSGGLYLLLSSPTGHFTEYLLWNTDFYNLLGEFCSEGNAYNELAEDGKLRVLIGRIEKSNKLILSKTYESERIVFDRTSKEISIANSNQKWLTSSDVEKKCKSDPKPLENAFGVRMARTGVLAEVLESGVRMFNSNDLSFGSPNFIRHEVSVRYFRMKVKLVEPRYAQRQDEVAYRYQPKSNNFQVLGHILEKKYNYIDGKDIVQDCPIVIEYVNKGSYFLYGPDLKVEKLCTDDEKLWVKTDEGEIVDSPNEMIALTWPTVAESSDVSKGDK